MFPRPWTRRTSCLGVLFSMSWSTMICGHMVLRFFLVLKMSCQLRSQSPYLGIIAGSRYADSFSSLQRVFACAQSGSQNYQASLLPGGGALSFWIWGAANSALSHWCCHKFTTDIASFRRSCRPWLIELRPAHFLTGGRLDSWQRVSFLQQFFCTRWKE